MKKISKGSVLKLELWQQWDLLRENMRRVTAFNSQQDAALKKKLQALAGRFK